MRSFTLKELLKISRPIGWMGGVAIFLLGVYTKNGEWTFATWWGILFFTFPMGLIVFGLNDIADRYSDKINERKGRLEGAVISGHIERLQLIITATAFFFFLPLLFLGYYLSAALLGVIYFFAYAYSYPPLRLKSKPVLDSASNALLWVLPMYLSGQASSIQGKLVTLSVPAAVWYLLLGVAVLHALGAVMDYEVDKQAGDNTIAVFLGERPVIALSFVALVFILLTFGPQTPLLTGYFVLATVLIGIALLTLNRRFLHHSFWTIALTFPIVVFLLILFQQDWLLEVLIV